jgi:uncharacterized membrane protein YgcG
LIYLLTLSSDVSNPESFEDLAELVPVLQKRRLMWEDYDALGGTYGERMLRMPGQKAITERHRSRQFIFDILRGNLEESGGSHQSARFGGKSGFGEGGGASKASSCG